jgi:hypothetical protein
MCSTTKYDPKINSGDTAASRISAIRLDEQWVAVSHQIWPEYTSGQDVGVSAIHVDAGDPSDCSMNGLVQHPSC